MLNCFSSWFKDVKKIFKKCLSSESTLQKSQLLRFGCWDEGNGIESEAVFQINDGHDVILPDCVIQ